MEHLDLLKQFGITSLEDAREFVEFTNRIVADLKAIDESDNDLDGLFQQTSNIVANLKTINEDNTDLDELVEQTSNIVANLKVIAEEA